VTRARPACLALVLLAGCEQQEAVPASRSVPVAALQLAVLLTTVLGGGALLERAARRRLEVPPTGASPDALGVVGAVVFGGIGLAVLGILAWWVVSLPAAYAEPTVEVLSWEDSVTLLWISMVPGIPLALVELRLAAACWFGRRWARWGAGIQLAVVAAIVLGSLAAAG
jgi:hypothetical protein